jgi:hypothetical protein
LAQVAAATLSVGPLAGALAGRARTEAQMAQTRAIRLMLI